MVDTIFILLYTPIISTSVDTTPLHSTAWILLNPTASLQYQAGPLHNCNNKTKDFLLHIATSHQHHDKIPCYIIVQFKLDNYCHAAQGEYHTASCIMHASFLLVPARPGLCREAGDRLVVCGCVVARRLSSWSASLLEDEASALCLLCPVTSACVLVHL
jgi:hypothetical protein